MIVYLDTSAVAKQIFRREVHASAFTTFLRDAHRDSATFVSSQLLETEVRRLMVRSGTPQEAATNVLLRINLVLPDREFFYQAGLLPGISLGSLDALHLATAIAAGADLVVSYDRRLLEAARAVGLPVASPA